MAVFTTASVLGIQSRGEFLGQDVARYRTVKTFNIEGFIDSRGNLSGVADTQQTINSYVLNASSSDSIMEPITINGQLYGTGRIISLDFRAAENTLNSQIIIGSYTAQIEMYESGDLNNVFGSASSAINNSGLKFIQDISEDFSFNRSEGDEYDYTHNVNITFISGVTGSAAGEVIDPFDSAYNVAQVLFDNRPSEGFDVLGNLNYRYDSQGLAYYTENKDRINGTCSFSKTLSLYPSGLTSGKYSAKITNSFEIDSAGIGYVTEKGEIIGRDSNDSQHEAFKHAASGLDVEVGQSFRRCSGIYDTYKSYIDNLDSVYLYSGAVTRDITSNPNTVTREYTVKYTDDEAYKNISYTEERNQSFVEQSDGSVIASEEGTLTSRFPKGAVPSWPIVPNTSEVKTRLEGFYTKSKFPMGGSLSLTSSSVSIPKYGKEVTYNYAYSDSEEVNLTPSESNLFNKLSVSMSDSLGGAVGQTITVPNRQEGSALYSGPFQTSLATRDITIEYQLKREAGKRWSNFLEMQKYYGFAKQRLIQDAYEVLKDLPAVFVLDVKDLYVSDVKISLQSSRVLQVTMQVTFPMQRPVSQIFAGYKT